MQQPVDATRIPELQQVVTAALAEARALGATAAEAGASLQRGLSVTVRLGEVDTIEYHRDRSVGVTVYLGQRKGSASSADFRPQAMGEMVAKAVAIARHTGADDCSGLADAATMATDIPNLDLDHPWELAPEAAVELARRCEAAGLAVDARLKNSEGATLTTHRGVRVYGNSHGFLAGYPGTQHSLGCALVVESNGDMQRDYWSSVARHPAALEAPEHVGRVAAGRTLARLGARRMETCKAPVLYAPQLARGLVGHLISAVRGSSQYRKSSFLLDAAGTQILPSFIQLAERPHLPRALGSSPFDAEGVATRDRELIANGTLTGYVLSSYSARKLGLKTTGNAGGIHNLLVSAPDHAVSFEQLLARMGRGLYVTELLGHGINGVTGDYSRGASGFWVEQGAIAYPVHELTIAGNLRDMYRQLVAVGTDVDSQGTIQCGSLLIDGMTIAGS